MFEQLFPFICGLGFLLIVLLVYVNIQKQKQLKSIYTKLETICNKTNASVIRTKTKSHDYILKTPSQNYFIKVVNANTNNEITITNYQRWNLNRLNNTKASRPIRVMNEIIPFANLKVNGVKVAIVTPKAGKILRYINESEVVFVQPKMDVWGYNVVNLDAIDDYFNIL